MDDLERALRATVTAQREKARRKEAAFGPEALRGFRRHGARLLIRALRGVRRTLRVGLAVGVHSRGRMVVCPIGHRVGAFCGGGICTCEGH